MVTQYVLTFKALANENRLRIFHLLCYKPLCVCELTDILNVSQATVSRHLQQLKSAGLIIDEKDLPWTQYRAVSTFDSQLNQWLIDYFSKKVIRNVQLKEDVQKADSVDRHDINREKN